MSKQSASSRQRNPLIITIDQQPQSCTCTRPPSVVEEEAAPFPFKAEEEATYTVSLAAKEPTNTSDSTESESTISTLDIDNTPLFRPVSQKDSGCALEVRVIEKHVDGCTNKLRDKVTNKLVEEDSGGMVGRMVYRTCADAGSGNDSSNAKGTINAILNGAANTKRSVGVNKTRNSKSAMYEIRNMNANETGRSPSGTTSIFGNGNGDAIKSSAKGFRLNDPFYFGKNLSVKRSRIDTIPILPNQDNCVVRMLILKNQGGLEPTEEESSAKSQESDEYSDDNKKFEQRKIGALKNNSMVRLDQIQKPDPTIMHMENPKSTTKFRAVSNQSETLHLPPESLPIHPKSRENLEVLSVYIRTNKNEEVPAGFQKMHYRGDSCKLHDPNVRNRQILALQRVMKETSSGAEVAKSNKKFDDLPKTQVMTATTAGPAVIPHTLLYKPMNYAESDDSLLSLKGQKITTAATKQFLDGSFESSAKRKSSLPREEEEDGKSGSGLLACFRKGKVRRQRDSSLEEETSNSGRKIAHGENQPKRYKDSVQDRSFISSQYSSRRH